MIKLKIPKKFYITTPIYYVSGKLHIGHAYTTIAADIFARYYRLIGSDVFFLTGTDEHGLKIQNAAKKEGISPQEFIDNLVVYIKEEWKSLDLSYDKFIRTSDEKHIKIVREITQRMFENGDIYKGDYEGYYCEGCESFYTEKDIVDGKCPIGHKVHKEKEKAYFFKLSKYEKWLKEYILSNPEFLQPKTKRNEVLAFIDRGLEDLCISREKVSWGISLPFDESLTIYVWLDALFNYLSALDYPDGKNYKKYWAPDLQIMGKEIFRFHTIYWPIFLKSLDFELPKTEFAHGWLVSEGKKMSKSFNNIIYIKDYIEKYGSDIFRYYLIREVPFGEDGSFSNKTFLERINNDLVATLGNLVSRVITLATKREKENGYEYFEDKLAKKMEQSVLKIHEFYSKKQITNSLTEIMKMASVCNKYVQDNKPWELLKEDTKRFDEIIYSLLEAIRIIAVEMSPIFTKKWKLIFEQLGLDINNKENLKLSYTDIMVGKKPIRKDNLFTKIKIT